MFFSYIFFFILSHLISFFLLYRSRLDTPLYPTNPFPTKPHPMHHVIEEVPTNRIVGFFKVHFEHKASFLLTFRFINNLIRHQHAIQHLSSPTNADWFLSIIFSITKLSLFARIFATILYMHPIREIGLKLFSPTGVSTLGIRVIKKSFPLWAKHHAYENHPTPS